MKSLATSTIQPSKPFPAFSTEAKISTATSFDERVHDELKLTYIWQVWWSSALAMVTTVTISVRVTARSDQETRLSKPSSWATAWG